ncbi:hypothetical protein CAEBREN_24288 [Caenorhabditis brenneri]|uniref:Uncharacterized protein n=1 Tax=Caenorhabditis brenneri TaxID=135651 RepID=G0PF51_CAEBE|nr:hypothetical protein CAEBREN_24288 [Caenorhabditis brenneri]
MERTYCDFSLPPPSPTLLPFSVFY